MIPYGTVAGAEAALGRGMTWSEAAWFRYSALIPDWGLLCHSFLIFFVLQILLPLPLELFERLAPPAVSLQYKLQPRVQLSQPRVGRYLWDTMWVYMYLAGPYILFAYLFIVKLIGVQMGLPLPSLGEVVAQLVVYSLVDDYLSYWCHRLLHTKWCYQKIHHVHHELTAPTGFTSAYAHWAEVVIFSVPWYTGPAIVPCHITVFWLWLAIRVFEAVSTHSGYDFPYSPMKLIPFYVGAKFHDYHHYTGEHSMSNFGTFWTYCDYIYGTDKGYKYYEAKMDKLKTKLAENKE